MKEFIKYAYRIIKSAIFKRKNVWISTKARFNRGTVFEGYNKIHKGATVTDSIIGRYSYIGENSSLINCRIGRFCCIANNVKVIPQTHPTKSYVSIHPAFFSTGKQCGITFVHKNTFNENLQIDGYSAIIGNDVWVASDVKIIGGIRIGDGAIIAMGSVVTKDVPPYAIVGGVPARLIRYRFNKEQIEYLLNLKWWNESENWLKKNAKKFSDFEELVNKVNI